MVVELVWVAVFPTCHISLLSSSQVNENASIHNYSAFPTVILPSRFCCLSSWIFDTSPLSYFAWKATTCSVWYSTAFPCSKEALVRSKNLMQDCTVYARRTLSLEMHILHADFWLTALIFQRWMRRCNCWKDRQWDCMAIRDLLDRFLFLIWCEAFPIISCIPTFHLSSC